MRTSADPDQPDPLETLAQLLHTQADWPDIYAEVDKLLHPVVVAQLEAAPSFELLHTEGAVQFQARLDQVTSMGAWPVGFSVQSDSDFWLMIAWPQEGP